MNKDKIKKGLECCALNDGIACKDCPYNAEYNSHCADEQMCKDALTLINEQEKEIDFQVKDRARLQNELDELEMAYFQRAEELDYAKKNCDRAFQRLEAQQRETDALKANDEETCWKCIESKRVTAEDYAKLQEEFANYQLASEKEIERLKAMNEKYLDSIESVQAGRCRLRCELTEQAVKQAKIDVLVELRNKCHNYYPSIDHYCCSVKAVNFNDINKMIEELKK